MVLKPYSNGGKKVMKQSEDVKQWYFTLIDFLIKSKKI